MVSKWYVIEDREELNGVHDWLESLQYRIHFCPGRGLLEVRGGVAGCLDPTRHRDESKRDHADEGNK